MLRAPPTTPTCTSSDFPENSSSRRCLQTATDAINPRLRGNACQGAGNSNCSSCLTDNGTFYDSDLIQNLTDDCGNALSTTRSNLCMAHKCYTALSNDPDIIAGNADCMVQAGLQQSALRRAGCSHSDIDLYCKNKAVGPAGCQSEYQTYENNDKFKFWQRPYGSGNSQDGFQFGANCPPGTVDIVMRANDADYAVCMPLVNFPNTTCPPIPTTSSKASQRVGTKVGIGGQVGCLLPCGNNNDCPGGQECHSGFFPGGFKFCAGRIGSDNRFHKDPTVSKLFLNQGCHTGLTGSNPDCHSCIKSKGVSDQQAEIFCDGMFYKINVG